MIRYTESETLVGFDAPGKLLNLNDRQHWAPKARAVAAWRTAAKHAAHRIPMHDQSIVTIELPVRDKRKRDPHNYSPTMKAVIDGLVDAGCWPDDDSSWVATREPVLVVDSTGFVTVRIEPV